MTSFEVEEVGLPQPKRGAWWIVVVVGGAIAVAGGASLIDEPLTGPPLAYGLFGVGAFLAWFALAMLTHRERSASLRLGVETLTFVTAGGEEVDLPWSSVRQAVTLPQGSNHVVALRKADGGWVEVASFDGQGHADRLVERLQERIEASPETSSSQPLDFEDLAGVKVTRQGNRIELSWSASSLRGLIGLGPIAGIFVVGYGAYRNVGGLGPLAAMGFVGALGVIVVIFTLVNLGATQHVVLEPERLIIQRRRAGNIIDEKAIPITGVAAIDYTHRLNMIGAGALTVRTDRVRLGSEAAERHVAEVKSSGEQVDALAFGSALLKAIAGGIQIPMGRLSLATRVGLDLALSQEVCRRSGRSAGTV